MGHYTSQISQETHFQRNYVFLVPRLSFHPGGGGGGGATRDFGGGGGGGGGENTRNFWVGMCHWDPGTLSIE